CAFTPCAIRKAAGPTRPASDDRLHSRSERTGGGFMASADGRYLIGSLNRMLTMDSNRIDE
ncbi:MAG TPA: hypothetical protein VHQ03_12715, partial [Candidatus Dormibacteraeota bacterium]|nr:hypothetical protein [Candidatus Dormibacteraeota bacterium]